MRTLNMNISWIKTISAATLLLSATGIPAQQVEKTVPQELIQNYSEIKSKLTIGQKYYVTGKKVNIRAEADALNNDNVVGTFMTNEVVELVDYVDDTNPFVRVRLTSSENPLTSLDQEYYVLAKFLSEKPKLDFTDSNYPSKYFVIQNLATEKTRVYERCYESPNCQHKLVLETDMVIGRPEEGTEEDKKKKTVENPHAYKTWLGHAMIRTWIKFYEDTAFHYPAWYHERFEYQDKNPAIPFDHIPRRKLNSSWLFSASEWIDSDYLTSKSGNKIGMMRGAFGWYAAMLHPKEAVNHQWIHGTIGWGRDGSEAIALTRGFVINMFKNPGSSGCTRLENRTVAFLRSFLEPGTHIYRIYAREAQSTQTASDKNEFGKWDFILTKIDAQKENGLTADAKTVSALNLDPSTILETGTLEYDKTPNAVGLNYINRPSSGLSGDRYQIDSGKLTESNKTLFKGYFIVDQGRLDGYEHPAHPDGRIIVGGLDDFKTAVPEYMKYKGDKNYWIPKAVYTHDPIKGAIPGH